MPEMMCVFESNLIGFYNILEVCRNHPVEHLVYASSSSVYGSNKKVPYSTDDKVDNPVTFADISALERDLGFKPTTTLREGLRRFAKWYKEYYKC